jgi:uncharacterized membrane protein YdbT with pleckstrin-like domain
MDTKQKSIFGSLTAEYDVKIGCIVIGLLSCTGLLVYFRHDLKASMETVLKHHLEYGIWLIALFLVLGLVHAWRGITEKYTLYAFNTFGPVLAGPLTGATYAIVIKSSIDLIYIIYFDGSTLVKFPWFDKITIIIVLVLLIVWATHGVFMMFKDCLRKRTNQNEGEIIKDGN